MPEPFLVHRIDPIIGTLFGLHVWWYGLSYALGFLNAHLFLRRQRAQLGLSLRSVYSLTLCLALGVLAGGRALVVFNHEWTFYREHPRLIPAIWLGGMATHGILAGGCLGVLGYCAWRRLPCRTVLDALAIPAAAIMGFGRIGNFIDGQIVGSVTSVPWAIQFPEADGFRHPVVLYDGLKNFLIIPILLWARRRGMPAGPPRRVVRSAVRQPPHSDRPAAGIPNQHAGPADRAGLQHSYDDGRIDAARAQLLARA